MLKKEHVISWLSESFSVLEENRQYLTQLDTAIGDADHGNNMYRGFKKVNEQLPALEGKDIGAVLKAVAMTLISTVGGASGPLYGTFFLQAATKCTGKDELTPQEVSVMFKAGLQGVKMRGKAQPGDKTMIDVLEPATTTLSELVEKGEPLDIAIKEAVSVAMEKLKETIPMIAKKGRASYLGERSKGHQDPGATSSMFILEAFSKAIS
ncbi:MAG: dihydroxyacetone kinase subunit L [Balneolales bacterium]|nr:dihydroxyacetone kinase subunit L [Balneolales bacterium]